jgi:hypothetical protein
VCARSHACLYAPHCNVICGPFVCTTFFDTVSKIARISEKKVTEHRMCVLITSTTFNWNISYRKKNSAKYCHKCEKSSCKVSVIFVGCLKNFKYQVSSKSVPWEPSFYMRTDGQTDGRTDIQTDMTDLIVAFRNFANAPTNGPLSNYEKLCFFFNWME